MFFESTAVEIVVEATPLWLTLLLVILSYLGSATLVTPALVVYHWLRNKQTTLVMLGIVLGGYTLRSLVKSVNSLSRPSAEPPVDPAATPALVRPLYEHPAEISTTSFPSGHTMTAVIVWVLFVYEIDFSTKRVRAALATSMIAIVGYSRVAVGSHYVGDVLGGAVLGLLFLAGMLWLRDRVAEPVAVVYGVAGLLAVLALTQGSSFTAEVVLGIAVGVLALWYGPSQTADAGAIEGTPPAFLGIGVSLAWLVFLLTGLLVAIEHLLANLLLGVSVGLLAVGLPIAAGTVWTSVGLDETTARDREQVPRWRRVLTSLVTRERD